MREERWFSVSASAGANSEAAIDLNLVSEGNNNRYARFAFFEFMK